MKIVTGWTGNYYSKNKEKYLEECLQSWKKAYPNIQICIYLDEEAFKDSAELCIDYDYTVVPSLDLPYYDYIRFETFTLQRDKFMWIDPDIYIKNPYPEEIFTRTWIQDDRNYQGFGFRAVPGMLSKSKLQIFSTRYNLVEDHFLVSECYILTPVLGYILGTEVLDLMREMSSLGSNMKIHREITEVFAGSVIKTWEPEIGCLDVTFPRENYLENLRIKREQEI